MLWRLPAVLLSAIAAVVFASPLGKTHKYDVAGKYFTEPGGGEVFGHYDSRFWSGSPLSHAEARENLQYLIRGYSFTFRDLGIETWIAHGTLLGWWWNGRIMPWDGDVDMQISSSSLPYMAEHLNMTQHSHMFLKQNGAPDEFVERTYLLDINPNWPGRTRGNWANVIDARFIDMSTGLFIDITALDPTNPKDQSVWSCKNHHRYKTTDLFPMRESVLEGVPVLVPYNYERILAEEYTTKALVAEVHAGHRWNRAAGEWVPIPGLEEKKVEWSPVRHGG